MVVHRWQYTGSMVAYDLSEDEKSQLYGTVLDFLPAQRDVWTREDSERFEILFDLNRTTSTAHNIVEGLCNRAVTEKYDVLLVRFGDDPADITMFTGDSDQVDTMRTEIKFYNPDISAEIYYLDELFQ